MAIVGIVLLSLVFIGSIILLFIRFPGEDKEHIAPYWYRQMINMLIKESIRKKRK